ncbi:MAG: undecaprenyldiphospho-muramoylpentapeptide beta-N-acetylglucosaminyltransferase [Alphaproteobacteria bacterium]|nr:undecaprenyldiphospho-muramoylpentapeptide beta-N-acetylglucosaminyltransferase [Alphaproteobacteria bacterium]
MTKRILLCAGGTGGHMFPADALARELIARGYHVELATDVRGQRFEPFAGGIHLHILSSGAMIGGLRGKLSAVWALLKGFVQSVVLIRAYRPDIVVGFGGYPTFPPVRMAQMLGVPTVIHESNAVMGVANLWLARGARAIATPTEHMYGLRPADQTKIKVTGNPVRPDIAAISRTAYPDFLPGRGIRMFVTGGSQGARILSDVLPQAMVQLPPEDRARIQIVQQVSADLIPALEQTYRSAGVTCTLAPFFRDMADQLSAAHVFIGRSGASTVAEMAAAGRPAVFVPYPHHKDQQQKRNAETLVKAGAAWIIEQKDFTPASVVAQMQVFLQNPDVLKIAGAKALSCGEPQAASRLADVVELELR